MDSNTTRIALVASAGSVALYVLLERLLSPKEAGKTRSVSSKGGKAQIGSTLDSTRLEKYKSCVYLDYNATTPIFPEVTAAMEPFTWACFGNPSSSHVYATPCRWVLELHGIITSYHCYIILCMVAR